MTKENCKTLYAHYLKTAGAGLGIISENAKKNVAQMLKGHPYLKEEPEKKLKSVEKK